MGEVIPFPGGRGTAAVGPDTVAVSANQCRIGPALLTWDPARRVAHLSTEPGRVLTGDHGRAIGAAVLGWVGEDPQEPYAFVVRGDERDDAQTDRNYRKVLGRGARRHSDQIRLVFYGGTPETRFVAEMYVRGVGVGAVFETRAEAWQWLSEHGF